MPCAAGTVLHERLSSRQPGRDSSHAGVPAPEPGAAQVRPSSESHSETTSSVSGPLGEDFLHM